MPSVHPVRSALALPALALPAIAMAALAALSAPPALAAADERPLGPLQLSFERLGTEEGLESPSINDLAQDAEGNIWIATHEGAVRYDGERFWTFGREQGLPSPFVFDVEPDRDGTLWAATLKGLARLVRGRFEPVELPGSPSGESVEVLALDKDGRLLVGAIGGVWRCRAEVAKKGTVAKPAAELCSRIFETPARQFVTAIALDPNLGELWFAAELGLVRWNGKELERWDAARGLGKTPVRALLVDRRGRLWIRQGNDTLRLDTGDGTLDSIEGLPPVSDASDLYEDRRGVIWATSDRGLFVREGESWRKLSAAEGLPSDAVSSLLEDFEGSIWIGTAYDGLARWLGRDRFVAWTKASGLPSDIVWAVARTTGGRLLFGTEEGLAIGTTDGNLQLFDRGELPGETVLAIEPDAAGGAWLGFREGGLAHLDATGRASRVAELAGLPAGTPVLSIESAPDGTLWVGTDEGVWRGAGGPAAIRFRREAIVGEPAQQAALPTAEAFHDLHLDRSGTLWAAGRYGLARHSRGAWRRYTRADGLADDFVLSVDSTADGAVWIAYRDALGIAQLTFDGDTPTVRRFDHRQGLAHDQAMFVRSDALGRLWVGTTRGLWVRTGCRFASFDKTDGMRGDDASVNSFLADPDGTIWVGSARGAIAVRLSEQDLGAVAQPAVRIRTAALGGIPFGVGEHPEVAYEQRNFEVAFGAKSFRSPRAMEFRYQLSGVDRAPVTTANQRLTYGGLAPGTYDFLIEARLRGGVWGPPARLQFTIRPPWWGRAPAQLSAFLAAALLGVLVDRLRGRRLSRRQRELEEAVALRTSELKASREELARKNDELGQLALTDALTGLKNRRFAWEFLAAEVGRVDREWQAAPPGTEPEARLVFFLMDVDLFKNINDAHGHEVGDQILIEAAERVRAATRLSDIAVRWGGEEFLIVARDLPRAEWSTYAARLRDAVTHPPFRPTPETGEVACTVSMGYAAYPFDHAIGIRWQQVLHLADLALYAVKQCGRNADLGVEPGVGWSGTVPLELLASQMSGALHLRWSSARPRRRPENR
jgi:diguanylate cyclase (GGDEF)-like protein